MKRVCFLLTVAFFSILTNNACSQQQYDSIKATGNQFNVVYKCDGQVCNGMAVTRSASGRVTTIGTFKDGIVQGELKMYNSNGVINEIHVYNKDGKLLSSTYFNGYARITRTVDWVKGDYTDFLYDESTYEYLMKEYGILGKPEKARKYVWKNNRWVRG